MWGCFNYILYWKSLTKTLHLQYIYIWSNKPHFIQSVITKLAMSIPSIQKLKNPKVRVQTITVMFIWYNVFHLFLLLTGRDDASLADTFPDPAGWDSLGLAVLFRFSQRMCGRGDVIVRYDVSIIRNNVPPQLVKVLHWDWQEKLHSTEDVQQRLQETYSELSAAMLSGSSCIAFT